MILLNFSVSHNTDTISRCEIHSYSSEDDFISHKGVWIKSGFEIINKRMIGTEIIVKYQRIIKNIKGE